MELVPFVFAGALALVHLFAGVVDVDTVVPHRWWLSFAGGVSVAYVFVHLLPELGEGQEALTHVWAGVAFLDHHIYLVSLVGFVLFHGLEQTAHESRGEGDEASETTFWLHVASFSVYNALIGYLLVNRLSEGFVSVLLFTVAMALHFFVTDAGLRRHHPTAYQRLGRWILAPTVVGGWALAQAVELSEPVVALVVAFLAGGIVLNVVKEEVPEGRTSAFPAFVVGVGGYAALLLAV